MDIFREHGLQRIQHAILEFSGALFSNHLPEKGRQESLVLDDRHEVAASCVRHCEVEKSRYSNIAELTDGEERPSYPLDSLCWHPSSIREEASKTGRMTAALQETWNLFP